VPLVCGRRTHSAITDLFGAYVNSAGVLVAVEMSAFPSAQVTPPGGESILDTKLDKH